MNSATRAKLGLVTIGGGIGVSLLHASHFARQFGDTLPGIIGVFLPSLLAVISALWLENMLRSGKIPTAALGRAATWYLGGGLLFAVSHYVSFSVALGGGGLPPNALFSVGNWAISGSAVGLVLANYDLRRSEALQRAQQNKQQAAQIAQRLSVTSRVLRHDIRNKLGIILGHTELLAEIHPDNRDIEAIEEAAESLLEIAERAQKLRRIVEEETPSPVNLTECLTELLEALQEEYPAAQITTAELNEATVHTYPEIREGLGELLENTIEHNGLPEAECEIKVDLSCIQSSTGEVARIMIEDNGPGIPEQEQIAFTDKAEPQISHSRGTSLWLTRWIVDESAGQLSLDTNDTTGTKIYLSLPVTADD